MQLKTRFLLVVAAATVTVATTVVFTSRATVGHIEQQSRTRAIHGVRVLWQTLVRDRRDAMDQTLTDFTRDRRALEALAQGWGQAVREKFITTFRRLQALGVVDAILMTDPAGEPVFAAPAPDLDRDLARQALEQGRIVYDLANDPQGRLLATVAMPVYRGPGRRAGAVVLGRRAAPILQALARRTGGEVARIGPDGAVGFTTAGATAAAIAAPVAGARSAALRSVTVNGRRWQVVGLPLRDGAGRRLGDLVSAVDRTAVLARNARIRDRASLMNVLVLLAALVLLYLYMNRAFNRDVADLRQVQT
ncbi:MAG TPA: cache domain-containing protein, partial [Gammaproteobacteria bacterium]|nr:cache domain-containing protein [Gammaproteobacteria bacterium]